MVFKKLLFLAVFSFTSPLLGKASTLGIDFLYQEMLKDNHDIFLIDNKAKYSQENINASRSKLWPSLSLSFAVNDGKETDAVSGAQDIMGSGSSGGIPSAVSSQMDSQSTTISQEGWSADFALNYPLFTKFALDTSIRNSEITYEIDKHNSNQTKYNKKKQLLQLLLEISSLKRINKTILRAETLMENITKNKRNKNYRVVASTRSNLKQLGIKYELEHKKMQVTGGLAMTRKGLYDLIPQFKDPWYNKLPKIKVEYFLPAIKKVEEKYYNQAPEIKVLDLDIQSFENVYYSTGWEKSWIPSVALSGSYSVSDTFDDQASNSGRSDNWRLTLLFSFNLFDGFYTQARRSQARITMNMAKKRKKSEMSKKIIYLNHEYYKAKASLAEYRFNNIEVEKKKLKVTHLKKISSSGTTLHLEKTMLLLDMARFRWKALEAHKKYQQSLLNIALILGEFDKVKVYETP